MKQTFKAILIVIAILAIACTDSFAQNVKQDASGNYVAVSVKKEKGNDKATGKTFTDTKGKKWPVFQSQSGKLYALRTSASGKEYKQYLKLD